jgi:hypothetical protein
LQIVGEYYENVFANDKELAKVMQEVFTEFEPIRPSEEHIQTVDRILPTMVVAIESDELSLLRGWGPPEDMTGAKCYGPGLRRLPYMYAQSSNLTTPLEKLVFQVLRSTYATLGTMGLSLISAWGEYHPVEGFRIGDADELRQDIGVRLLDPDALVIPPLATVTPSEAR